MAQELDKLIDNDRAAEIARERVEQMGIIFIDEVDKIAAKEGRGNTDVSERSAARHPSHCRRFKGEYTLRHDRYVTYSLYRSRRFSHQQAVGPDTGTSGRFPLRVELQALDKDDFTQILTQPQNALIKQYEELMKTEGVTLDFTPEAIERISEIAAEVNSRTENIGARRLHTIMELLLEDVSFSASEISGQTVSVTPQYVDERLKDVVEDQDLSRYIL